MATATITFTPCEIKDNQFDVSYVKENEDGTLFEMDGAMEPYHSGQATEHVLAWGSYVSEDLQSQIDVEESEGVDYNDSISLKIENEIYAEFYNQVKL